MHYVYVLQALDDRTVFYLGFSSNLKQRVKAHNGHQRIDSQTPMACGVLRSVFERRSGATTRGHIEAIEQYAIAIDGSHPERPSERLKVGRLRTFCIMGQRLTCLWQA